MKAISIRQPYAELIARGEKTLEVRTWRTNYRGPLLVVASRTMDLHNKIDASMYLLGPSDCPRGVAVCLVDLVDCRAGRPEDKARALCEVEPTDFVFELARPRRLEPAPVKGRLGIFDCYVPVAT